MFRNYVPTTKKENTSITNCSNNNNNNNSNSNNNNNNNSQSSSNYPPSKSFNSVVDYKRTAINKNNSLNNFEPNLSTPLSPRNVDYLSNSLGNQRTVTRIGNNSNSAINNGANVFNFGPHILKKVSSNSDQKSANNIKLINFPKLTKNSSSESLSSIESIDAKLEKLIITEETNNIEKTDNENSTKKQKQQIKKDESSSHNIKPKLKEEVNLENYSKQNGQDDLLSRNENMTDEDWKELTEDDIEFLLDNTGFNLEQINRWHKEFLNRCCSGLIRKDQFKAYYKLLLPKDLNEKSKDFILDKLFYLFDIDGDGCLNFTEFLVSFWIRCKAPIREKYTWIFNMLDEDRNGYLSYTELRKALGFCLNLDDLDELLNELNAERINIKQNLSKSMEKLFKSQNCSEDSSDDNDLICGSSDNDESFLDDASSTTSSNSYSFNKDFGKKYNLYSKTICLVQDKLNETIFLLYAISQNVITTNIPSSINNNDLSKSSSSSLNNAINNNNNNNNNQLKKSSSTDSLDSSQFFGNKKFKIQVEREDFLNLCERYKLFRKLLLPIRNFYEENLIDD